jgi:predicted regulator of Ras-like GTPase activity (Roadblock/LC7/MglB family)
MFQERFLLDEIPALCYSISRELSKNFFPKSAKYQRKNYEWRSAALTKSRSQMMVERLRDLQASSPDIEASAVVSVDGLTIASALPQGVEEDRVSAMSAAMLSLGERIASELGRGSLDQVYIKGEQGYVVLMSVGEEAVLTALAREQAKLGLIFLDMRRATEDLEKLI